MVKGAAMKKALLAVALAFTVFSSPGKSPVVTCPVHNDPSLYVGKSRVDSHGAEVSRLYYHSGHYFWVTVQHGL
jgi:hypothetical protein